MSPLTLVALAVAGKATLIVAAATLLLALCRRQPAALRHLILAAAGAALLMLPLVTPATPAFALDIPVAAPAATATAVPITAVAPRSIPVVTPSIALPLAPEHQLPTVPWWLLLWVTGSVLFLLRIIVAQWRIRRVVGRADDAVPLVGSGMLATLCRMQRVHRIPGVGISRDIESPLMTGLLKPIILLPSAAADWTEERRRIVLIHELAHVARFDHVVQLIGEAGRMLFWFHPGVWFIVARLRAESEHAADDRVISAGHPAVLYATHLVEIARGAVAPPLAGTVAMARLTHLEERVRAMLQNNSPRGGVTRRHQIAAVAAAFAAALPLAGLRTHVAAQGAPRRDVVAARQMPDTVVRRSVTVTSGGLLHVGLRTGGDVVVRGTDENAIRVTARTSTGGREPDVSLDRTADGASLDVVFAAPASRMATFRTIEILVPRRYSVSLQSAGGSVRVDGLEGSVSGHTDGGDITVAHTTGRLALTSSSGAVHISDSHLDGYVSTDNGAVVVQQVTGALTASSSSSVSRASRRADVSADIAAADAERADIVARKSEIAARTPMVSSDRAMADAERTDIPATKSEARAATKASAAGSITIIAGRVTDESGRPVADARVRSVGLYDGAEQTAITDAAGAYRLIFSGGTSPRFRVVFSSPGHALARYDVAIQPDDDRIVLDARLRPISRDTELPQVGSVYGPDAQRDSLRVQSKTYWRRVEPDPAGSAARDSAAAQRKWQLLNPDRDSVTTKWKYPTGDPRTDSLIAQDNFKRRAGKYFTSDTVYQVDGSGRVKLRTIPTVPAKPR